MEYTTPSISIVSMSTAINVQNLDGKETASGCSGSCCYGEGSSW